jgi:superfamily II DNA or RNA helicase
VNAPPLYRVREDERRVEREVYYIVDASVISSDGLFLRVENRERTKSGEWGKLKPCRLGLSQIPGIPGELDREILLALAGAPSAYYSDSEGVPYESRLKHAALDLLLPKICATGRCLLRTMPSSSLEEMEALQWDRGDPWRFRVAVERQRKEWALRGFLERGGERMDLAEPAVLTEQGVAIAHGRIARFDHGGVFSWAALLKKEKQIKVPVEHGTELVAEIFQGRNPPEIDWPAELQVEEVRTAPRPVLKLSRKTVWNRGESWRRPAPAGDRLQGQTFFEYSGDLIPTVEHARGLYRPEQRRYVRRDPEAERAALEALEEAGLKRLHPPYGETEPSWELTSKKLPSAVRKLAQAGWRIEAEGKTLQRATGFRAEFGSGVDWFELRGAAEFGERSVKLPELLKALNRGEEMVPLGDGSFGIVPEEFLRQYGLLARLGRVDGDHVRFSSSQAGLLDVLLEARPEIKIDEVFARAREELRSFDGIEPVAQPAEFVGELRGYQREGLAWMGFLRRLGFGGCLADDMGVGKTPQVLAMLESRRQLRETNAEIGPSLVVAPRSLIYNWAQESARFTPRLRVLDQTGAGRERDTAQFDKFDLILTTYGTLRRDIALLQDYRFDHVILDEAQAIKNAASESAKAARLLQARYRLALSGTPIENHLGELWSLLEFLNPGMLGAAAALQGATGALRNPDEETRRLLSRALRPFILRRTKAQVAKELPEKIEQTIFCELDAAQRKLYNELREHYRQTLLGRVESEGLAKSKMHILEALLRLRQAACHPGLIDKKRAEESSAKLETLLAQLAEVNEEGHKALVFSQFTSLLSIVRQSLDKSGVVYEYLDGKTADRRSCVERFQGDADCKLFLISLKAGGVGLNLTAAEYVFLLDPWWNPAVEAQAIDRTHRIGQSQPVFAYRLIARDTVEEKVLELQQSKRALADAIIGEDNRLLGNLNREDLELLLS